MRSISEKSKNLSRINLTENDAVVWNEQEIAEIFNNFFLKVGSNNNDLNTHQDSSCDKADLETILNQYDSHPSIAKIKENIDAPCHHFSFCTATVKETENEILSLNASISQPPLVAYF